MASKKLRAIVKLKSWTVIHWKENQAFAHRKKGAKSKLKINDSLMIAISKQG